MGETKLYDFPQAIRMIGESSDMHATDKQWADMVRYAVIGKHVVEPMQIGKARLFNARQIETIKRYFAERQRVPC